MSIQSAALKGTHTHSSLCCLSLSHQWCALRKREKGVWHSMQAEVVGHHLERAVSSAACTGCSLAAAACMLAESRELRAALLQQSRDAALPAEGPGPKLRGAGCCESLRESPWLAKGCS